MSDLISCLKQHSDQFGHLLNYPIDRTNAIEIDFSIQNREIQDLDLLNTKVQDHYIKSFLSKHKKKIAIGGYNEERFLYQRSQLFQNNQNPRFIHLGLDIWTKAFHPIYAPFNGQIHSIKNNTGYGDYGPTIILKHELKTHTFFTLFGHLSIESLSMKQEGDFLHTGELFCTIGNFPENGDWSPHLHFQLITDLGDYVGDFPGVCSAKERLHFTGICPNPNLLLNIPILK